MNIYINLQELYERISQLENVNEMLLSNMNNIEKLVLDLGYEWQGKSALVYQAKILVIKKQYQILNSFITDYCNCVKSVISDYEELEKTIKQQMEV